MRLPETINASWIATLADEQLLQAEARLHELFRVQEKREKARTGATGNHPGRGRREARQADRRDPGHDHASGGPGRREDARGPRDAADPGPERPDRVQAG